jgi:hypothetical protein
MKDFPLVNGLKMIGYCFYNSRTYVAIVLCVDTVINEKKAYIGAIEGKDMRDDLIQTISYGAKFDSDIANSLIKQRGNFV